VQPHCAKRCRFKNRAGFVAAQRVELIQRIGKFDTSLGRNLTAERAQFLGEM
jgi:hypothetical protein